ncbi:MAG: hypothetical protein AMXMBFR4_30390 [Candidatus Hydrogenedentota bacterium]
MLSWRRDNKGAVGESKHPSPTPVTNSTPQPGTRNQGVALRQAGSSGPAPRQRLGELLVQEGIISHGQLADALKRQQEAGSFIGQILVESNIITQSTLVSFLVKQCKIPYISLLDYVISDELFKLVPKELCEKYRFLPIDKLGKILTLAMVDPLDADALEHVREVCPDLRIKPILCDWNHFDSVARRLFQSQSDQPMQEVSMGSLGLTSAKPRPDSQVSEVRSNPHTTENSAVDAAVAALVQEAAAKPDTGKANASSARHPEVIDRAPGSVTLPDEVLERFSTSIRGAMQESLAPLLRVQEQILKSATQQQRAQGPAFDPHELAREISSSLRSAIMDAIPPMQPQEKSGDPKPAKAAAVDSEIFTALGRSMQESMAKLAREVSALAAKSAQSKGPTAQELAIVFGEAVRKTFAEQDERLMRVADAAGHAAEAAQRALEAVTRSAVSRLEAPRIANLEPFPGVRAQGEALAGVPEIGVPEALDAPGLGMESDERVRAAIDSDHLLRGYVFDDFLAGPSNSFTITVARAAAERLSQEFNPLFLFGGVGVGKTHVLNAIGNSMLARNRDLRVGYLTAGHFASAFAAAQRQGEFEKFRGSFSHWDVLILDDAQFLADRHDAQEELLHVFDALHHEGRFLIIAADRAPDQLKGVETQLVSRFSSGVVTRLRAPEMDVRMAILQRHAQRHKVSVPDEILTLIASRITDDVRKLTGALRKVVAYAKLVGRHVTRDMVNEILNHLNIEAA